MEHHGIKTNIVQAIFSRKFIFGVIGFVAIIFLSRIEVVIAVYRNNVLQASGFYNQFILGALKSEAMMLCLPIICSLPYTISFVEDIKSGFIKSYLHRVRYNEYLLGKVIGCGLSG